MFNILLYMLHNKYLDLVFYIYNILYILIFNIDLFLITILDE